MRPFYYENDHLFTSNSKHLVCLHNDNSHSYYSYPGGDWQSLNSCITTARGRWTSYSRGYRPTPTPVIQGQWGTIILLHFSACVQEVTSHTKGGQKRWECWLSGLGSVKCPHWRRSDKRYWKTRHTGTQQCPLLSSPQSCYQAGRNHANLTTRVLAGSATFR